jgi:hypothetical protein
VAVFPIILAKAANVFGVAVAANFLFFVSIIFLLLVAVQLSFEVSKLEGRTRRLAEDLALLRWELRSQQAQGSGLDAIGSPALSEAAGSPPGAVQLPESCDHNRSAAAKATAEP